MRIPVWIGILVITAGTLAVKRAAAADAIAPVHLNSHIGDVTTTESVSGTGNVHIQFSSVEQACLIFEFSGDLLDPGDGLFILVDGRDAGGFDNPGPEPQAVRTLCWTAGFAPSTIADFLDGKAKLEFIAANGSVTLRSVSLTISGAPR